MSSNQFILLERHSNMSFANGGSFAPIHWLKVDAKGNILYYLIY